MEKYYVETKSESHFDFEKGKEIVRGRFIVYRKIELKDVMVKSAMEFAVATALIAVLLLLKGRGATYYVLCAMVYITALSIPFVAYYSSSKKVYSTKTFRDFEKAEAYAKFLNKKRGR